MANFSHFFILNQVIIQAYLTYPFYSLLIAFFQQQLLEIFLLIYLQHLL